MYAFPALAVLVVLAAAPLVAFFALAASAARIASAALLASAAVVGSAAAGNIPRRRRGRGTRGEASQAPLLVHELVSRTSFRT